MTTLAMDLMQGLSETNVPSEMPSYVIP